MAKPSHSSYVLQQLNNQREWGFLCDCCIAIDDIYFQAHKAVLAACSSYFRMFFMNHQHSTAQLNLTNMKISAECFDLILQFMYLGKIRTAPSSFEQSEIRDIFVEMLDDFRDNHYQINSIQKKQLFKHSACPFRCPNCGQHFETENLMVKHMSSCLDQDMFKGAVMEENERDHRRKHFCNLYGKGFYQRCHLREHCTVHTKEKQFVCQTCWKQFLREHQLRLHNDMHKGVARYVCSICDQGNFRKHDHVRHMISHLSGGETICQVCFQIFPNNEQLEKHMDVHLYTCGICGAKFNLRKDMRSHYNAKHLKRT